MESKYDLSEAEQSAIDSATRLLGPNLADYLLSGLGEEHQTYRRVFTARGPSRQSDNTLYQFEMINESEQGLPAGRDPLVLAALLDKLWKQQPQNGTLRFHESEVMEKLGWPSSAESKSQVKNALEKYLITALCLVDPTAGEDERVFGHYARFTRLLVSYETTMVGVSVTSDRGQIQLTFSPEFIECLTSNWKQFLGVEFQRLRGMRRIDSDDALSHV
jgi:hypothetical protein